MVDAWNRAVRHPYRGWMGATVSIADSLEQLDHCLNAAELARLLNVHKLTIYRLVQQGRIPALHVTGTCIRFDPRRVAEWLRARGGAL
jgi:excisionase family DNA binding protein